MAAKKPKVEGEKRPKEEGGQLDMEALLRAGTLAKLTVDQIKTWLKVVDLKWWMDAKLQSLYSRCGELLLATRKRLSWWNWW